jgi:hypothetical protein
MVDAIKRQQRRQHEMYLGHFGFIFQMFEIDKK